MRLGMNRRIRLRILPPYMRPRWRQTNKWLVMLAVIIFISVGLLSAYARVRQIIGTLAEAKASYIAVMAMNEAINQRMLEGDIAYDDLVILQKNAEGKITAISTNVAMTNKLKSQLAIDVQERIANIGESQIAIPLGSIFGNEFLEGVGPRIPVKLIPAGFAVIDFTNSFTSAGINQTRHAVSIQIKVNMSMLLPTGNRSIDAVTHVPVAETIIVGDIPQSYINVEGTTGTTPDKVLQIME